MSLVYIFIAKSQFGSSIFFISIWFVYFFLSQFGFCFGKFDLNLFLSVMV